MEEILAKFRRGYNTMEELYSEARYTVRVTQSKAEATFYSLAGIRKGRAKSRNLPEMGGSCSR